MNMPTVPVKALQSLEINLEDIEAGRAAGLPENEVRARALERAIESALDAYGVPCEGRSVRVTMNDDKADIKIFLPDGWHMEGQA
jgi:hypothetical protein